MKQLDDGLFSKQQFFHQCGHHNIREMRAKNAIYNMRWKNSTNQRKISSNFGRVKGEKWNKMGGHKNKILDHA